MAGQWRKPADRIRQVAGRPRPETGALSRSVLDRPYHSDRLAGGITERHPPGAITGEHGVAITVGPAVSGSGEDQASREGDGGQVTAA
ncbi:hypothetical protein Apa02nite_085750 [Actinoplanes palleronii]|uniref:Uncharacterized protein n=1 Tax=Actinoplanes palleronii TaxID=113570 RepID=A0ABQ4BP67_9ACTN|nr:hypothetical protein Apa02nite_085750 [Actinoplanes palleronii]